MQKEAEERYNIKIKENNSKEFKRNINALHTIEEVKQNAEYGKKYYKFSE